MANRMGSPISPPSMSRPASSVLADDCTLDTHSSQGGRIVKHSPRPRFRRGSPRTVRGWGSPETSAHLFNYHDGSGVDSKKAFNAAISETARAPARGHEHADPARPDLQRIYSFPSVLQKSGDGVMEVENLLVQQTPADVERTENRPASKPIIASNAEPVGYHGMFKQPETNPITEEQLVNEVRGIYAGLVMVEKKCIEFDKQQAETGEDLSPSKWQALISLHRTLLYEHHDFFLASQHPSASPVLKRLADKYAMPARMWRYGIHSFLELLRQRLPESLDYMLNFINLAYSMMTLLLESVSSFRETWVECLGDLARYRMAVEESDMRDREVWAGVSRYWYNQYADRSPGNGRIQHHLAVLARPDVLQQLFYYTKALVTVRPFPNARESIVLLFNTDGKALPQTMVPAFIATHGILFTRGANGQFITCANQFLSLLRRDINRLDRQGQQGVYIMCCNFAALLGYGDTDAILAMDFSPKEGENVADAYFVAREWISHTPPGQQTLAERAQGSYNDDIAHDKCQVASRIAFQGSSLAFHTLSVFLDQMGDPTIYASIHTSLAFIWCLALRPNAMQQLEQLIPWLGITNFLNTLLRSGIDMTTIEDSAFPLIQDAASNQLPEDFVIRGQAWSQLYYPPDFFEGALSEDDRPIIEEPSITIPRKHRCLWLGVRLATLSPTLSEINKLTAFLKFARWITYSSTQGFEATGLAHEFAPLARNCGQLNSYASWSGTDASRSDVMCDA
ncbi:DNA/RNA-binding domain E.t1.c1-type [Penicillium capsulatum]|uniref:DNA/RNA-binding domain E.t1.c1-type n=1 Tax=Penicillium capsulatum TaxID=69766 RepID=A0A9W9IPL1_9EURO|nr:DNA/RNA-binding domain E.t1.c1-type [Penicillium capsulatum]KAJ6130477.1 DNA/RNA-binding domain E.t1.c1-type [Penicillium capsulatum]